MKLTPDQIQFIDNYLQFLGVKFIDVRLELLDHLASEFENRQDEISLEDFIRTKKSFVRDFEIKLHRKRHWGYQKALINRVLMFFYIPKYLVATSLLSFLLFQVAKLETSSPKMYLFFITLIVPQVFQFYIYYKPKGMYKKIQSAQYILTIMSLPSLFLYCFSIFSDWLLASPIYFAMYWGLAFIFNVSGIIEVIRCKKRIVSTYRELIKN